jgi:hypothetical protein
MLHGPEKVSHRVLANHTVTYRVFADHSPSSRLAFQVPTLDMSKNKAEQTALKRRAVRRTHGCGRCSERRGSGHLLAANAGDGRLGYSPARNRHGRFREGTDKISRRAAERFKLGQPEFQVFCVNQLIYRH